MLLLGVWRLVPAGVLEIANALADASGLVGQTVRAEEEHDDDQDNDEFWNAKSKHVITPAETCRLSRIVAPGSGC